jgi:hypothetical protein
LKSLCRLRFLIWALMVYCCYAAWAPCPITCPTIGRSTPATLLMRSTACTGELYVCLTITHFSVILGTVDSTRRVYSRQCCLSNCCGHLCCIHAASGQQRPCTPCPHGWPSSSAIVHPCSYKVNTQQQAVLPEHLLRPAVLHRTRVKLHLAINITVVAPTWLTF